MWAPLYPKWNLKMATGQLLEREIQDKHLQLRVFCSELRHTAHIVALLRGHAHGQIWRLLWSLATVDLNHSLTRLHWLLSSPNALVAFPIRSNCTLSRWSLFRITLGDTQRREVVDPLWLKVSIARSRERAQDRSAPLLNLARVRRLCNQNCFCSCLQRHSLLCHPLKRFPVGFPCFRLTRFRFDFYYSI